MVTTLEGRLCESLSLGLVSFLPPMIDGMPVGALEGRLGRISKPYLSGSSQLNFSPPSGSGYVEFRFNDQPGCFT